MNGTKGHNERMKIKNLSSDMINDKIPLQITW